MIIDSHVHFGKSSWGEESAQDLINIIEDVDFAICSNLAGIESSDFKDEFACNIEMLETSKTHPKLKPLYVCQPNLTDNTDIARKLLTENPEFVGLKLHPECMKLPADSEKYNLPCLYHSGHIKSRFSSPELIYKKAKDFPDVKIILGHLSTGPKASHEVAIKILLESIEKDDATLFVDTSWIDFAYEELNETMEDTLMLIEALKDTSKGDFTHRILWASDCPVGKFNKQKTSYSKNLEVFSCPLSSASFNSSK